MPGVKETLFPLIPDGTKLTHDDFAKLADDFLERMKLKEQQYISFLHRDKDHKHLHIFVNRIDSNGKAYKDHFISKKVQIGEESIKASSVHRSFSAVNLQKIILQNLRTTNPQQKRQQ